MPKFHVKTPEDRAELLRKLTDIITNKPLGEHGFSVDIEDGIRTPRQGRSLQLYCGLVADALNEAGLDMRRLLKAEIDIPWTKTTVKENIWNPIMVAATKKASSTQLERPEVSMIYDIMHRALAEKHGVDVRFPHKDWGAD